jgi:hypothetical protein
VSFCGEDFKFYLAQYERRNLFHENWELYLEDSKKEVLKMFLHFKLYLAESHWKIFTVQSS